jgi:hypothetical protein
MFCPLFFVDNDLPGDLLYGDELYFPQFGDCLHRQGLV